MTKNKSTKTNQRKKYHQLINQFNGESNEQKRERLLEKIAEYGWNF